MIFAVSLLQLRKRILRCVNTEIPQMSCKASLHFYFIPLILTLLVLNPENINSTEDRLQIAVIGQPSSLRDRVEKALLRTKHVHIVDLKNRKRLLNGLVFDRSGLVSADRRKEIGQLLSVGKFVEVYSKEQYVSVHLTDAETGRIESSFVDPRGRTVADFSLLTKTVANMLEGLAARHTLARLKNGSGAIPVKVEMPDRIKKGRIFSCTVTSGRDGYLTLFDIQPDGTLILLLESKKIRASEPFHFPDPNSGTEFEVGGVLGLDTLYALVTVRPFRFPRAHLVVSNGFKMVREGKREFAVKGLIRKTRLLPRGAKGVAVKSFWTIAERSPEARK